MYVNCVAFGSDKHHGLRVKRGAAGAALGDATTGAAALLCMMEASSSRANLVGLPLDMRWD